MKHDAFGVKYSETTLAIPPERVDLDPTVISASALVARFDKADVSAAFELGNLNF